MTRQYIISSGFRRGVMCFTSLVNVTVPSTKESESMVRRKPANVDGGSTTSHFISPRWDTGTWDRDEVGCRVRRRKERGAFGG